jgi:uncharacterized membrane protein
LWYDSLLFFFFGWIGLFLGMLSIFRVNQYLKEHLSYLLSEIATFFICLFSSFGIYLGRFERWNSWDVFLHPFVFINHLFYLSVNITQGGVPLMFIVVFTVFMYSVYKTMYPFLS